MKIDWNNEVLRAIPETDDEIVFLNALAESLDGLVVSLGEVAATREDTP